MVITTPFYQEERRRQARLSVDRSNDLHKFILTPQCRSCLEQRADGVLLLDNETQVIYASSHVDRMLKKHNMPFAISPKFTLRQLQQAARFAAFVSGKNQEAGSLSLLMDGENGHDFLLLNCFKLSSSVESDFPDAFYMVTLRDIGHFPSQQRLLFNKQFNLTQAESRLCYAFSDGLTLNDYCKKWQVATSTARSQLHNVFDKTSTHRQCDLLRLILLFSRT